MTEAGPELYKSAIRQHAADPVGRGSLATATHEAEGSNPLCGDEIRVFLEVADETIKSAGFEAQACAICTASCSVLCGFLPGKTVADLPVLQGRLQSDLKSTGPMESPTELAVLLVARDFPVRHSCALLPWQTAVTASLNPRPR